MSESLQNERESLSSNPAGCSSACPISVVLEEGVSGRDTGSFSELLCWFLQTNWLAKVQRETLWEKVRNNIPSVDLWPTLPHLYAG